MSRRPELRAQVWDISGGRCEHPVRTARMIGANGRADAHTPIVARCMNLATELAHIVPRGMGHQGDRDRLVNVMAACPVHARSTDDLSSPEWDSVPGWKDDQAVYLMTKRQALAGSQMRARSKRAVGLLPCKKTFENLQAVEQVHSYRSWWWWRHSQGRTSGIKNCLKSYLLQL